MATGLVVPLAAKKKEKKSRRWVTGSAFAAGDLEILALGQIDGTGTAGSTQP